jgi:UDP:flavonoid glycosyltransferase YjiC (YdhE family)
MPTPCVLETDSGTPAYLGGWTPQPGICGQTRDYCGRKFVRGFKRLVAFLVREQLRDLGFSSFYRADRLEAIYSPERILALGIVPFEFPRNWPAHVSFLGPVTGCPSFPFHEPAFVHGKKHILITLGTHLWWAKDRVMATLQAVAHAMPDCVFHFTKGSPASTEPHIDGNLHQYSYIPYDTYLGRYDAAIVHGGTGVVYSCLKAAVPMLVWPHDYDQFDHAARVVDHRLGLRCRLSARSIEIDLRWLLADVAIRKSIERFGGILNECHPHSSFAEMLGTLDQKRGLVRVDIHTAS